MMTMQTPYAASLTPPASGRADSATLPSQTPGFRAMPRSPYDDTWCEAAKLHCMEMQRESSGVG